MQHKPLTRALTAATFALAAGALSTNVAAAILYTPWQSFGDSTLRQTSSSGNTTFNVNQYNPAAWNNKPLHNIEIQLTGGGYVTYSVTDLSNSQNNYNLDVDINVAVSGPGVGDLIIAIPSIVSTGITLNPGQTVNSPGWPTDFLNGLTGTDNQSKTYVGPTLTPALAGLFTGTGTVTLTAGATQNNQSSATGDVQQTVLSRYTFNGQIRYSYEVEDTPEPATMLLLGAGLAGVGALSRRRRKMAA